MHLGLGLSVRPGQLVLLACLSEQPVLGAGVLTPFLWAHGSSRGGLSDTSRPPSSPARDLTEAWRRGVVVGGCELQELLGETGGDVTGAGVRAGTEGVSRELDPSCKAHVRICGSQPRPGLCRLGV